MKIIKLPVMSVPSPFIANVSTGVTGPIPPAINVLRLETKPLKCVILDYVILETRIYSFVHNFYKQRTINDAV